MIDFFHKGASITKKVTGIAKLKGAPVIHPRSPAKVSRVGTFRSDKGSVSILLEVADTDESRRHGLMGRSELPEICGMLFEGLSNGGYFWMKNCLVPLDIAFMDKGGTVTKTYSMPADDGENHYEYGDDDVSAVELAMGFLSKHGIGKGSSFWSRELEKEAGNG